MQLCARSSFHWKKVPDVNSFFLTHPGVTGGGVPSSNSTEQLSAPRACVAALKPQLPPVIRVPWRPLVPHCSRPLSSPVIPFSPCPLYWGPPLRSWPSPAPWTIATAMSLLCCFWDPVLLWAVVTIHAVGPVSPGSPTVDISPWGAHMGLEKRIQKPLEVRKYR